MKILHVVPSYLPARRYGGPILSIHGLCAEFARQGHDVHVYTTSVDGSDDSDVPLGQPVDLDGVKVSYFPSRSLRRLYFSPSMKPALVGSIGDFDVLHLHSIFLWPTWFAARCARKNRTPYVLAPRGMLVRDLLKRRGRVRKNAWIRVIEKKNLEQAAAVHATSEAERDEIRRFGFALQRLVVVPNGCTVSAPPGKFSRASTGNPLVLFLGRMSWKKGLDRLINAMSYVPDAELVLAGNDDEGYLRKLDPLIARLDMTNRVRFTGFVDQHEKARLLQLAHVLVLPSYSENFGNVVLEAMSYSCPVIVTPEVGIAKWVEKARAGLVVQGEPADLADAITRVCGDLEFRTRLGENGSRAVERDFAWPRVAERMLSVYRDVTEST